MWEDVWQTLAAAGGRATLLLFVPEVVDGIAGALDASAWGVKRQGAAALQRLLAELTAAGDFASVGSTSSATGASAAVAGDGTYAPPGTLPFPAVSSAALLSARGAPEGSGAFAAQPTTEASPTSSPADTAAALYARCVTQHRSRLRLPPCIELRPHACRLAALLLAAIPGRVWEGKESLVTALGELCARCPGPLSLLPDAAAAPPAGAAEAGTATAPAEAAAVSARSLLAAAIACLVSQTARDGAPLAYATASAQALALVCAAAPAADLEALQATVLPALEGVLRGRCGRSQLPSLTAGAPDVADVSAAVNGAPPAAPAAATAAAPRGVVGGRFNEATESEGRLAAKLAEADVSSLAAACALALAASLPPLAEAVSADAPPSAAVAPDAASSAGLEWAAHVASAPVQLWLREYCAAHGSVDVSPAAFAASLSCVLTVRAGTPAVREAAVAVSATSRVLRLLAASLPLAAGHPSELATLARAAAVAWTAVSPAYASSSPELTAAIDEAVHALVQAAAAEGRHTTARNACLAAVASLLQGVVCAPGPPTSGTSEASGNASGTPSALPVLPAGLVAWLHSTLCSADGRLARMTEPFTAQWVRLCESLLRRWNP